MSEMLNSILILELFVSVLRTSEISRARLLFVAKFFCECHLMSSRFVSDLKATVTQIVIERCKF